MHDPTNQGQASHEPSPSPGRSTNSEEEPTTTYQDSIFPTPSTSPWSSPRAFNASPWSTNHLPTPTLPPLHHSPSSSTTTSTTLHHRCLSSVTKQQGKILSLALIHYDFSGTEVIYAGTDSKSVRIWKLPCFNEFGKLRSGSKNVEAVVVSVQHGLVFTAHSDRKIRVWYSCQNNNNTSSTRKGTLPSLRHSFMEAWVHHPVKTIFTANNNNSNNQKIKHSGLITSLAYNPMLNLLYSGSLDHTIKVWTTVEMKLMETIDAHDGGVNSVLVGNYDGLIFSGSEDETVKIWEMSRRTGSYCCHDLVFYMKEQRSSVNAMVIGGGGSLEDYVLYVGCGDGYLHHWMKRKRRGLRRLMEYTGFVNTHGGSILCLAAVEKIIVSGSANGSVRVWRRRSRTGRHWCTAVLEGHTGPVKGVAARSDGNHGCMIYSGGLDGCVKQWRVWKQGSSGGGGSGEKEEEEELLDFAGSWREYFEISSPHRTEYPFSPNSHFRRLVKVRKKTPPFSNYKVMSEKI